MIKEFDIDNYTQDNIKILIGKQKYEKLEIYHNWIREQRKHDYESIMKLYYKVRNFLKKSNTLFSKRVSLDSDYHIVFRIYIRKSGDIYESIQVNRK